MLYRKFDIRNEIVGNLIVKKVMNLKMIIVDIIYLCCNFLFFCKRYFREGYKYDFK